MGMWDMEPWDNDSAADWFGDLFEKTKLRDHVVAALKHNDPEGDFEEIRAAAYMIKVLGHTYVWPIDHIDEDIQLAVSKMEKVLAVVEEEEYEELTDAVREELEELRSRIDDGDAE